MAASYKALLGTPALIEQYNKELKSRQSKLQKWQSALEARKVEISKWFEEEIKDYPFHAYQTLKETRNDIQSTFALNIGFLKADDDATIEQLDRNIWFIALIAIELSLLKTVPSNFDFEDLNSNLIETIKRLILLEEAISQIGKLPFNQINEHQFLLFKKMNAFRDQCMAKINACIERLNESTESIGSVFAVLNNELQIQLRQLRLLNPIYPNPKPEDLKAISAYIEKIQSYKPKFGISEDTSALRAILESVNQAYSEAPRKSKCHIL